MFNTVGFTLPSWDSEIDFDVFDVREPIGSDNVAVLVPTSTLREKSDLDFEEFFILTLNCENFWI